MSHTSGVMGSPGYFLCESKDSMKRSTLLYKNLFSKAQQALQKRLGWVVPEKVGVEAY